MPNYSARYLSPDNHVTRLPNYLTLANGDIIETSTMTEQQLAVLLWRILHEENPDYDPDIQTRTGEEVHNNATTITYSYTFKSNAREVMMEKIDILAEKARALIAASLPLQTMEYAEAHRQAKAYIANSTDSNENWTFLDADIGRTLMANGQIVSTRSQAALTIIAAQALWAQYAGTIRNARLDAKARIRDALSDAAAYEIYKATAFGL